ncbi:hypothetical protein OZD68_01025 [Wolbachia endosymbiont of Drosophila bicornuta]|uniref:hypothetical protein n=1 Tax=Wolbachia TaxID=953 RepID=UPI0015FDFF9E|nr:MULTISPECIES: hypothetical protein [Wolbachia]MBA8754878.1 hypothetical protein [Wolbachia pipientis]MDE5056195.1 hypothetical protein [Wolbachia endosymbiont of Drosophila bicornuta]
MLLLYHSHKHISYPIRTIARSAINPTLVRLGKQHKLSKLPKKQRQPQILYF